MAKNKDPNLVTHPDGTVSDPNTEIKTPSLSDLGIDAAFVKDTIKPLIKDIVVAGVRKELGLGKSELRKGSTSHKISTFLKEITSPAIILTIAAIVIYTMTKIVWRWVGL